MVTSDWVITLYAMAQAYPIILADLPSMTWADRWGVYLYLRRLADTQG